MSTEVHYQAHHLMSKKIQGLNSKRSTLKKVSKKPKRELEYSDNAKAKLLFEENNRQASLITELQHRVSNLEAERIMLICKVELLTKDSSIIPSIQKQNADLQKFSNDLENSYRILKVENEDLNLNNQTLKTTNQRLTNLIKFSSEYKDVASTVTSNNSDLV